MARLEAAVGALNNVSVNHAAALERVDGALVTAGLEREDLLAADDWARAAEIARMLWNTLGDLNPPVPARMRTIVWAPLRENLERAHAAALGCEPNTSHLVLTQIVEAFARREFMEALPPKSKHGSLFDRLYVLRLMQLPDVIVAGKRVSLRGLGAHGVEMAVSWARTKSANVGAVGVVTEIAMLAGLRRGGDDDDAATWKPTVTRQQVQGAIKRSSGDRQAVESFARRLINALPPPDPEIEHIMKRLRRDERSARAKRRR